MTSYEAERALVYFAEQIIKTFGKEFGVEDLLQKPHKTLIKDNKLKEIFRKWGKLIGIDGKTTFKVTHHNCSRTTLFQSDDDSLFTIELPGYFGDPRESYTLEQIIGDKESKTV